MPPKRKITKTSSPPDRRNGLRPGENLSTALRSGVIALLALSLNLIPASARSQIFSCDLNWNQALKLSRDSVLSISPEVETDGNSAHVIWFGIDTLGGLSGAGIQYSHSFNNGEIFSSPRTIVTADMAFSPGLLAYSSFNLYVAFTGYIGGTVGTGFVKSSDGGFTWSSPLILRPEAQPRSIATRDSVILIHYADQRTPTYGLLRSGDYGRTWRVLATGIQPMTDIFMTDFQYHSVGVTAAAHRSDVGYFLSPDLGAHWYGPEIISPEDAVSSLYPRITLDELDEKMIAWNDSGSIIFRRSNGYDEEDNIRWLPGVKFPASENALFPEFKYAEGLLVAVWDSYYGDSGTIVLQHSTEKGESFCPPFLPSDGGPAGEPSMSLEENVLSLCWSGAGEIFFRRGIFPGETRPKEQLLRQNYPNPFRHNTTIEYEISREGMVRLEIFDLLGRKVETLVHEVQKPRRYQRSFNGSSLAPGVYFCRLWTVQYTDVKKMMLVR